MDARSPDGRREAAWNSWTSLLPETARRALDRGRHGVAPPAVGENSNREDYDRLLDSLPALAVQAVSKPVETVDEPEEIPLAPEQIRFLLVDCPDGEYPRLISFRTAKALAAKLGSLDGKDTVAWAFYGVHLPFTMGPQRYLTLPEGDKAIQVPRDPGGPSIEVDVDFLSGLEIQGDGYLGPDILFNEQAAPPMPTVKGFKPVKPLSVTTVPPPPVDDDDDDDDDEDDDPRPRKKPAKPRR